MKNARKVSREQQEVHSRRAKNCVATQSGSTGNDAAEPPVFVKKKVTNRKIGSLRPHPKQAIFPDLSPDELRRLAESMKRGLDEPVEILPNGTIISGHQRVKAAKLLGWKEIRCWVRHDLAEQGDDAVERRLIEANFHRRQLGPLDKARCYRRLMELERDRPRRNGQIKGDLRDYFAKQFGYSGRNLDRWVKVLDTPMEIQRAVEQKKLKLEMGVDVAALPQETQEEIARAIRKGVEPTQAVAEYMATKASLPAPDTAYNRFYRALEQALKVMGPRAKHVDMRWRDSHLPMWQQGRRLIDSLVTKGESARERN